MRGHWSRENTRSSLFISSCYDRTLKSYWGQGSMEMGPVTLARMKWAWMRAWAWGKVGNRPVWERIMASFWGSYCMLDPGLNAWCALPSFIPPHDNAQVVLPHFTAKGTEARRDGVTCPRLYSNVGGIPPWPSEATSALLHTRPHDPGSAHETHLTGLAAYETWSLRVKVTCSSGKLWMNNSTVIPGQRCSEITFKGSKIMTLMQKNKRNTV